MPKTNKPTKAKRLIPTGSKRSLAQKFTEDNREQVGGLMRRVAACELPAQDPDLLYRISSSGLPEADITAILDRFRVGLSRTDIDRVNGRLSKDEDLARAMNVEYQINYGGLPRRNGPGGAYHTAAALSGCSESAVKRAYRRVYGDRSIAVESVD